MASQREERYHRIDRYRSASAGKRKAALGQNVCANYYQRLVVASQARTDTAAKRDRDQIRKDLPRTFDALPFVRGTMDMDALQKVLEPILVAYVERGRSLSATSMAVGCAGSMAMDGVATGRSLLTSYPQGLNFLAGMSILAVGIERYGPQDDELEEMAFWLLALLLEDVLDPDFFGAGAEVRGNRRMACIGGLGMKTIIVEHAQDYCPAMFAALGREAFASSLSPVLDKWVLSLFIGCAPHRLLEQFWDCLLLQTHSQCASGETSGRFPHGLATIVAFALAALKCCGEDHLRGKPELLRLEQCRRAGMGTEDLNMEAAEAIQSIKDRLCRWDDDNGACLLQVYARIRDDLAGDSSNSGRLWEEVRKRKQQITNCTDNFDEQLMTLADRTHFSVQEIEGIRSELRKRYGGLTTQINHATFKDVVKRIAPEFPHNLCGRLFIKLDVFNVGRLAFTELVCGMSALALGTMDEKLKVCFDLFDSEDHRGLTTKDVSELCAVLFRVALAQGFEGTRQPSTTDTIVSVRSLPEDGRRFSSSQGGSFPRRPAAPRTSMPTRSGRLSFDAHEEKPWQSMYLRLISAARVRNNGGPRLVAFEDFRNAAHMEPALLCLFSWCLPRTPDNSGQVFGSAESDLHISEGSCWIARLCRGLCNWLRSRFSARP